MTDLTWIVRVQSDVPSKDGEPFTITTWWFGPDHGFGTTSGSRDDAAQFTTKRAAIDAIRSIYGCKPRRMVPMRIGGES